MGSKFDEPTIAKLEQAVRMGATYELASKFAGITYQTFRNWILKGENAKSGTYLEFYERIQKAEGDAAVGWLAKIEKSANDGNWQAAAWKLERRYPADYNRNRVEVSGADGGAIRTQQTNVNIQAENAHDASDILKQLAELGAIPPATSNSDNHAETE